MIASSQLLQEYRHPSATKVTFNTNAGSMIHISRELLDGEPVESQLLNSNPVLSVSY